MNELTIFNEALERADPEARNAFLDQACQGDAALRQRIDRLLAQHQHAGSFLEAPPFSVGTIDQPGNERPGTVIDLYKLIEQIGEGGMGTVWMAQQQEPVKRLVALKVIKAGMDSRQVIARFEAERQALALMDHPNIARVLDGGSTCAGRPYFVMDLVRGVPITRYCDEHHLTPRQRLELFIPVCQAIQHAHQKGIIHRDLKPSNVLVALYDGRPVPKVIDFGVAKAAGQPLTEQTLVTGFGNIVGTLEYMSPEQAEINQLDIDTRSDIYSLGVLLYELLTGSPPFSRKGLEQAGMLEMLRVIREQEPSKPSTKLSTADGLPTLAANRGTEPANLTKLIRGELDWIVMKALEKDRNRRYETANGFAMDVQRYLADEAVQACPPTAAYRFRKFASRNKPALLTAAAIATALILGTLISTWQAVRATRAEQLADRRRKEETAARQEVEKQRQTAEAQRRAAEQARQRATNNLRLARNAVDQMLTQVGSKDLVNVPQMEPLRRALLEKALQFYQKFLEGNPDDPGIRLETANTYQRIGKLYDQLGQYAEAERTDRESIRILEELEAEFPQESKYELRLTDTYDALTSVLIHLGQYQNAEQAARSSLVRARKLTAGSPEVAGHRHSLSRSLGQHAAALEQLGRYPEAEQTLRESISLRENLAKEDRLNPDHRRTLAFNYASLANVLTEVGRPQEAEEPRRRAIQFYGELVAEFPNNPEYLHGLAHNRLIQGLALCSKKQFMEAEKEFQAAIELDGKAVADFPKMTQWRAGLAQAQCELARLFYTTGRLQEAERVYRQALELQKILVAEAPGRPFYEDQYSGILQGLALVLSRSGQAEKAAEVFDQLLELQPASAAAGNGLAWFLATCPEEKLRDPRRAVKLARKAVELDPKSRLIWNTLGAALYRAGEWQAAIPALEKSMELSKGGDSFDWFFLAMTYWQLGEKDKAREWFDRAVQWMDKNRPTNEELRRFRAEAAELMQKESGVRNQESEAKADCP